MKKILLSLVLVSSIGFYISAQVNLLKNGDFEEQGAWKVCQGNLLDTIWYEFGSTENTVNGGVGANLAIKHTGLDGPQDNLTVYQALNLVGGEEYLFSCAVRDMSTAYECWWMKYCWIALEPVAGSDVDEQDICALHEWMDPEPYGFNGLLDTFSLGIAHESKTNIFVPEADDIYFVGINFGTCDSTIEYHWIVDEIALIDQDSVASGINTPVSDNLNTLDVYPNPATTNIDFTFSISKYSEVELSLINILGHEVAVLTNEPRIKGIYNESFDCSNLANGVYYCVLKVNKKIITKKIILLK
jgi:hypothetical protein